MKTCRVIIDKELLSELLGITSGNFVITDAKRSYSEIEFSLIMDNDAKIDEEKIKTVDLDSLVDGSELRRQSLKIE